MNLRRGQRVHWTCGTGGKAPRKTSQGTFIEERKNGDCVVIPDVPPKDRRREFVLVNKFRVHTYEIISDEQLKVMRESGTWYSPQGNKYLSAGENEEQQRKGRKALLVADRIQEKKDTTKQQQMKCKSAAESVKVDDRVRYRGKGAVVVQVNQVTVDVKFEDGSTRRVKATAVKLSV